ncbi:MAG TPA: flagellar hook-basal body complex protein FliE [Methanomassiliicoccaceae archaeon]|nr:flagellar hook-basal body complex protein FliE [Methanomassiliicoccaceae archaeon]
MRIQHPGFTLPGITHEKASGGDKQASGFVDALEGAIASTNSLIKESEQAASALSSGSSPNIHETMIAMQKADIALRLLVSMTNKVIEGYNQLIRLG